MVLISDDQEKIITNPRTIMMQNVEETHSYVIKVDGHIFGYYRSKKTALDEMQNISLMIKSDMTYQVHSCEE